MSKILIIGIIIIMTLSACETPTQPGTGGYDPETQSLLAIATQTGAANLIAQTEVAKQATAQAVYAEQTAVSYSATATRQTSDGATAQAYAQETAVSATETAVHLPISVQQTTEAQAVFMERENAASTATAVAIQRQMANEAKTAERMDLFWRYFFIFLGGLGVALVIGAVNLALRFHKPVPPIFSDDGIAQAVDNRFYQLTNNVRPSYRAQPVLIDQPKEEPAPPINNMQASRPVKFSSRTGETKIEVNDRNPGIDPFKWQCFAAAVLVDGVSPTRRAITEANAYISQSDHKAMYDYLIGNELARTGVGDALILDISEGYEFLYNKLPPHMQRDVTLPHPDGLEPILE